MELAFMLTPGLHMFLAADTSALAQATTDVTLFYSVTVLSLLGHIPFSVCVGLWCTAKQIMETENSITFAALLWLFLALMSVMLLIIHIVGHVTFVFHAVVVIALLIGSVLRLAGIVVLPYAFFANGDPTFNVVWWWLLCGIDWPDLPTSASVFIEVLGIGVAAQAVYRNEAVGPLTASIVVLATPMVLRITTLSDLFWFRVLVPLPALVYIVVSIAASGSAFDLNRMISGWTLSGPVFTDDLEKGE
jgi:hypothetical protein